MRALLGVALLLSLAANSHSSIRNPHSAFSIQHAAIRNPHSAFSIQHSAFEFTQVHMGLPVRLLLHTSERQTADTAARDAFARMAHLDRMMSDYRPDSELHGLDHRAGDYVHVSPDLVVVVRRAVDIARATDGAFDPTVAPLVSLWRASRTSGRLPEPDKLNEARSRVGWQHVEIEAAHSSIRLARPGMRLDLGGIAKGYILQEALHTLRARGVTRALIESGGDIVVGDAPPGRPGWSIDAPGADAIFVERASHLTNAALATSGPTAQFIEIDGVRYSHIVDPRTGLGVTSDVVARVIADDAATADALATALTIIDRKTRDRVLAQFPEVIVSVTDSRP